jgi:hypothetical protein
MCLAVPENVHPDLINAIVSSIRRQDAFNHYEIHVMELPHVHGAVFNTTLVNTFIEEARQYGTFAFLTFQDGAIHFVHGEAILDRWRKKHDSRVYMISVTGDVQPQQPLQVVDHVLTRCQTSEHIWDPSQHYMLPFLH